MEKEFKLGEKVYFYQDGKVKYRRIIKILQTDLGTLAMFEEGCAREIGVPMTKLYHTITELQEREDVNE